jgi:DNA-binding PadR family transcriptional regulator
MSTLRTLNAPSARLRRSVEERDPINVDGDPVNSVLPYLVKFFYYALPVSITRMMILGLVRWLQPVHGYDVRRELLSWDAESWANIQPGSIYHALRKLADEGLLEEVATEQVGARPARTTYRVTPKGDAEFVELLRKYWWELHDPVDPFAAAFAFLPALPRPEAVAALRNRARTLDAQAARHRDIVDGDSDWVRAKPSHLRWQFELVVDRLEVEAAWCVRIADRIEADAGFHAHEQPTEELLA